MTLDSEDYARLSRLAQGHRPPLSLQYVVAYAVRQLLAQAEDRQLPLDFGIPVPGARDGP